MKVKKTVSQKINDEWPDLIKELESPFSFYPDEIMDAELTKYAQLAMSEKLKIAREKGRGGWWSEECSTATLKAMLVVHVTKGDMRDVMNIAAMIYLRESAGIETNTLNGSKGE